MSVDLMLPAAEKITLVLEGIRAHRCFRLLLSFTLIETAIKWSEFAVRRSAAKFLK